MQPHQGLVFWQARVKAQRGLTLDKQAYIVYNPLGLVFWQAGVKAQRGLTPDKQAYIVCNPLGLVFHRGRVEERSGNPATNDASRCCCE